jgi:hypothetical protein
MSAPTVRYPGVVHGTTPRLELLAGLWSFWLHRVFHESFELNSGFLDEE